jgi:hypothetical protein
VPIQLLQYTNLTMMSSSKRKSGNAAGKQPRPSTASSSSRTNGSGIGATLSRSASMRSTGFVSPNGKSSIGDNDQPEEDGSENQSKPSQIWLEQHTMLTDISTGDQTTVNLVVTDTVFPKVKFVDRDTDLVFSNERRSICQFVIGRCNLNANISLNEWWKHTQKYVAQTINRLRNDRNTAMKWAVLGKLVQDGGFVCNMNSKIPYD